MFSNYGALLIIKKIICDFIISNKSRREIKLIKKMLLNVGLCLVVDDVEQAMALFAVRRRLPGTASVLIDRPSTPDLTSFDSQHSSHHHRDVQDDRIRVAILQWDLGTNVCMRIVVVFPLFTRLN